MKFLDLSEGLGEGHDLARGPIVRYSLIGREEVDVPGIVVETDIDQLEQARAVLGGYPAAASPEYLGVVLEA